MYYQLRIFLLTLCFSIICFYQHTFAGEKTFEVEYDEGAPSYTQDDLPLKPVKPDRVTASSILPSKSGEYKPDHAADGKAATAWCKGVTGTGAGEWLRFEFKKPVQVTVLSFVPFYAKNAATLANNNRIKKMKIEMDGGVSGIVEFSDAKWCKDCQLQYPAPLVNFYRKNKTRFIKSKSVKFIIMDVYPGSKYNDTCISDIEIQAWTGK